MKSQMKFFQGTELLNTTANSHKGVLLTIRYFVNCKAVQKGIREESSPSKTKLLGATDSCRFCLETKRFVIQLPHALCNCGWNWTFFDLLYVNWRNVKKIQVYHFLGIAVCYHNISYYFAHIKVVPSHQNIFLFF